MEAQTENSVANARAIDDEERRIYELLQEQTGQEDAVTTRKGSPQQLVKVLVNKYYFSQEVAGIFGKMAVSVFLRLDSDAIWAFMSLQGGSLPTDLAMILVTREDILETLANDERLSLNSDQTATGGGANGARAGAKASGALLRDPFMEGETTEGKNINILLFGVAGGTVTTKCSRMPTCKHQGEIRKNSSILLLPAIGAELISTCKDDTVKRSRIWLVVIRLMCKLKWEKLGNNDWIVDASGYLLSMVFALGLESEERQLFQMSVHILNLIKHLDWATSHKVLMRVLQGE
jgi:hypothetical protein